MSIEVTKIFHKNGGFECIVALAKNRQKIKRYVGCIARLPN